MPKRKVLPVFVPKAQQPYQIPHNWRWVRLGTVCDFIGGGTPSKKNPAYWNGSIPWASVKDIKGSYLTDTIDAITEAGLQNSASNLCDIGDLILITRIEPAKTVIAKIVTAINQDLKIVKSPLSSLFLHYYFQAFRQSFLDMASGSTVLGITISNVENAAFPLPPLAEQQRIVERIESLFTKLDAAREKAREVVDGFELRKAAILHRAFTGELTEQWRANNGASSGRKTVTIASVCHSLKYGTAKKSAKAGNVVVLRMGNLQGGEIDWSNLAYSNDEEDNEKYSLSPGDVLFNRTNSPELVGKTSIYRGEFPAIYAGYLIKLDYNRDIISGEYLNYMLNSPEAKEYCKTIKTDGVNQSNINAKRIGAFLIPLPSLNEQKETEKRLQSILRKQLQVSEAAQQVIDNIDAMKRAILGRAFRGELGTNDPSEAGPDFAVTVR